MLQGDVHVSCIHHTEPNTNCNLSACNLTVQVPLGTVVHRLLPPESSREKEEEEPFRFQQHWVGARDYVSSDEDSESEASTLRQNKDADLEVTTLEFYACMNKTQGSS